MACRGTVRCPMTVLHLPVRLSATRSPAYLRDLAADFISTMRVGLEHRQEVGDGSLDLGLPNLLPSGAIVGD